MVAYYVGNWKPVDMGPTLGSEKLAAAGMPVTPETGRRWLIADQHRVPKPRRGPDRERRERRARFGELVQVDDSHHRWFGPDGSQCYLMNLVHDATGHTYSLLFEQKTTEAAMRALWGCNNHHRILRAVCGMQDRIQHGAHTHLGVAVGGPSTAHGLWPILCQAAHRTNHRVLGPSQGARGAQPHGVSEPLLPDCQNNKRCPRPKGKVVVHTLIDDAMQLVWLGRRLHFHEVPAAPDRPVHTAPIPKATPFRPSASTTSKARKPADNHP